MSVHGLPFVRSFSEWQFRLQLTGFGYQAVVQPVAAGQVESSFHHLAYHRPGITEWYVNNGQGLEHGFTLSEPPQGRSDASVPLRLELAIDSGLSGTVTPDGASLSLANAEGTPMLRYEALLAFDATGRQLPAPMEVTDGIQLALTVDDRGAAYPVMVDPVIVGLVKDINLATEPSFPQELVNVGGVLLFRAYQQETGSELWKSDGTVRAFAPIGKITGDDRTHSDQH